MTLNLSDKKLLLIQQIIEIDNEQTLIKILNILKENKETHERLLSTNSDAFEWRCCIKI